MCAAVEIGAGLVRWTAPHPDWTSDEDWEELVGSLLYELGEVVVLFDPLLPREDPDRFLEWLDQRIVGRPVSVLTTIRWHRRDRLRLAERYRASTPKAWNFIPPGVDARWLRGAGEVMFWLPGAAALVAGDRLLGAAGGELRLCPESWLEEEHVDRRALAELMAPLLELPIERVIVSHGEPVLRGGRAALARAIAEVTGAEGEP